MLTACLAVQHPHLTFLMLHPGWVQTDMGGAGGRTADIGVQESVAGIYKVVTEGWSSHKRTVFMFRCSLRPLWRCLGSSWTGEGKRSHFSPECNNRKHLRLISYWCFGEN